jgi:hypothetical protein
MPLPEHVAAARDAPGGCPVGSHTLIAGPVHWQGA